ncbi:F-box/FBD/LRR-repeat protein At1g13570-like [Lycium barbarum]|uniref:F-box/FBD/LRR-repeat protein At1g13570-like n=1 Tax=Lycium barbarum TaxID=112863 RepID=UPI00293E14F6|nr:F-box/FBD/LRR-repeat protein At1g13570-like [Lycium barbarum]XP_060214966.1 F-box/FBD/LRR-repeat protein At1g13570-like [Lycium barbarum]
MSTRGEKRDCQTAPLDILCSLPENVVDDILMRLPLRDAMQTSILSKKWRYNWCRLPELTLDLTNLISTKDSIPPMFKFTNIIYHLLTLHTGPITKFDLSFSSNLMPCPTIDNLIYFLSRNGIQHLVLKLSSRGDPYKLPTSLFTCFQLRRLTLQYCSIIPPPAFKGFDQLISLELRRATITSKFLESLISHCVLLEQLVLDISNLSGVVEINAPRLRCFKFAGEISSIYLKYIPLVTELSLADMECYEGPRICDIAKFFESFPALEHLRLNHGILMYLAAGGDLPIRLPFDLNCIKCLCLADFYLDELDVVSCALCLIRSFPFLRYLEIQVDDLNDDIPALECLEVEAFSDATFNNLREVQLTSIIGSKPEMQLIKLLLAKSPMLVRMLVEPYLEVDDADKLKISDVLNSFRHASPEVEVVYTC